jgi:hypothetical protein
MPKTLFVLPMVFALSLLLMPTKAVADLPEDGSGQMVVDEVCEAIRQYQKEKDEEKRSARLIKLGQTRDPRVAIILGEMLHGPPHVKLMAVVILLNFLPAPVDRLIVLEKDSSVDSVVHQWYEDVEQWWEKNEADLRRRAKQLPQ